MSLRAALRRMLGGEALPEGFTGRLEADERVLAVSATADGAHLVVTSWGLWVPERVLSQLEGADARGPGVSGSSDDGHAVRRIGWHLVSRAVWKGGALAVVEAVVTEEIDGAALLADRPTRRFRLVEPGRVPEAVHARVEGSIRSRHHRELPGGGAWFVQRKVPGRDGTVLQVRPDPGTDPAVVAQVAADVARSLHPAGGLARDEP